MNIFELDSDRQLYFVLIPLVLLVAFVLAKDKMKRIRNKKALEYSAEAKVVDKKHKFIRYGLTRSGSLQYSLLYVQDEKNDPVNNLYYVRFVLNGTKQIWLQTSKEEYQELKEGMQGTLRYKGNQFLEFKKHFSDDGNI